MNNSHSIDNLRKIVDELIALVEPNDGGLWLTKLKFERKNWDIDFEKFDADAVLDWLDGMGSFNNFMIEPGPDLSKFEHGFINDKLHALRQGFWFELRSHSNRHPYPAPKEVFRGNEAIRRSATLRLVVDSKDAWQKEYVDPNTGAEWILDYPDSELHGGGPPRLMTKAKKHP